MRREFLDRKWVGLAIAVLGLDLAIAAAQQPNAAGRNRSQREQGGRAAAQAPGGQEAEPERGPSRDGYDVAPRGKSSYMPVEITEDFSEIVERMSAQKAEVMRRHRELLEERYDLSNRPARNGLTYSDRDKPIQEGVRVKLPEGVERWEQLAGMKPEEIREKDL